MRNCILGAIIMIMKRKKLMVNEVFVLLFYMKRQDWGRKHVMAV